MIERSTRRGVLLVVHRRLAAHQQPRSRTGLGAVAGEDLRVLGDQFLEDRFRLVRRLAHRYKATGPLNLDPPLV